MNNNITGPSQRSAARRVTGSIAAITMAITLGGLLTAAVPVGAQEEPVVAAPAEQLPEEHVHQIIRLYKTVLGRNPGAEGLAYWVNLRLEGQSLFDLVRVMLTLPEPQAVSSGDIIIDAYWNALGRDPDAAGYEYWSSLDEPAHAVVYISDSLEHQQRTLTVAPPPPLPPTVESEPTPGPIVADFDVPEGWVDAGHGVFVPPVLLSIRFCESRDNYTAANPRSSARGAYQFLRSSWAAYGHAERYGVSTADQATPAQQDEAAVTTWERSGTRPWLASVHCWG